MLRAVPIACVILATVSLSSLILSAPAIANDDDRVCLGVEIDSIENALQQLTKLAANPPTAGVVVAATEVGIKTELRISDGITHINGKPTTNEEAFWKVFAELDLEIPCSVTLQRVDRNRWTKTELKSWPMTYRDMIIQGINESPLELEGSFGFTSFTSKLSPASPDAHAFHLILLARNTSRDRLFLRLGYQGEDWIYFDSCTIKAGDQTFDFNLKGNVQLDRSLGKVWESTTVPINARMREMIDAVLNAQGGTIHFHGQNEFDREIKPEEIKAFRSVLELERMRR